MTRNVIRLLLATVIALALAACDDRKEDILKKSESAKTREQLRAVIGDPDHANKVGPIETWTYQASNGSVIFTLAGDTVMLKATVDKSY